MSDLKQVAIEGLGDVYREEGTAIFYLDRQEERNSLIILADDEETLAQTIIIMATGEFRRFLVSDKLGV